MERRRERLERLERATEWPLTILALAIIPLLLAPSLLDLSDHTRSILDVLDYMIWGLFAADFGVKVAIAPARRIYLQTHWVDALLVALPMLRPLRVARSMRSLRLLRASRAVTASTRFTVGARRILVSHNLHFVLAAVLVSIVVGGSLAVAFERGQDGATIATLSDGIWWAITTVTTVGYGDAYPTTAAGRGVGVAMMIVGITLFSALTANLAAFFVEQNEDNLADEIRQLREELARLRQSSADPHDQAR